jgi:O-antigen/teichoic acid export membrane protein
VSIRSRLNGWWSRQDSHLIALARGASIAGILKALSALLAFALSVVLGRFLGAEAAGAYFLSLTVATIAATVGRMGLDSAVVRFVAGNVTLENWSEVRSVYRSAVAVSLICSSLVAATLFLAADFLASAVFSDPHLAGPLRFMAVAVVPLSMSILLSRVLQGFTEIRDSVLVFSIIPTGIALTGALFLAHEWGVHGAIVAYIIAVTVAMSYGWISWRRALSKRTRTHQFELVASPTRALLKSGSPLLIGALLQLVIQMSGTLMLGILSDNTDVSQFAVAWRTALVLTLVLLAVNMVAQPKFADLYARGEMAALGVTANKAALLMAVFASPIFLIFLLAPKFVMSAFGSDFIGGAATLQILSIGQFVNVAAGSVGVLLVMSGHEREYRNVQIIAACATLILNFVLIPPLGAEGAAIAAAFALIMQNVLFGYYVWLRLGILTIIPSRFVRRARSTPPTD